MRPPSRSAKRTTSLVGWLSGRLLSPRALPACLQPWLLPRPSCPFGALPRLLRPGASWAPPRLVLKMPPPCLPATPSHPTPSVVVFNLTTPGNVLRAILGDEDIGTSIGTANPGSPHASDATATLAGAESDSSESAAGVWEQQQC